MSKKQKKTVPEYTFKLIPTGTSSQNPLDQSPPSNTSHDESEGSDMFNFTPAINSNYTYSGESKQVHDRLLKAGEYYK